MLEIFVEFYENNPELVKFDKLLTEIKNLHNYLKFKI